MSYSELKIIIIIMMMMKNSTIGQFWTVSFSLWTKVSQTLQSVLCITTNKYLVRVLVVLLHARFSIVGPIPFLLAAIFFPGHPYIGSTTVLPDYSHICSIISSRSKICTTARLSTIHLIVYAGNRLHN